MDEEIFSVIKHVAIPGFRAQQHQKIIKMWPVQTERRIPLSRTKESQEMLEHNRIEIPCFSSNLGKSEVLRAIPWWS